MKNLWGGRFEADTSKLMDEFNRSLGFDIRLFKYDIMGSKVHVRMLARQNIIEEKEKDELVKGLSQIEKKIKKEIENDEIDLKEAEDIHSLVEKRLTAKIGPVAGKMHTARSRNDQVALDIRLYLRDKVEELKKLIKEMLETILELADDNLGLIMPGYTHLQRAQPITFAHHLLAYYYKLKRDYERFEDNLKRINVMPLGSGALAGSSFPLDRKWVSQELGFDRPCFNSLDGVSDRDFILEFLSISSNIMVHLSRFSEEIILWNSAEFSFIELDDRYATGSSIMPQKKNPDLAELARGKSGRVFGHLFQLLTTLKGLPLAYNKDLQEDKEGLFDTVDTLKIILRLYPEMLETMMVKKENMIKAASEGFLNATELANHLTRNGIPFRSAHGMVGKAVLYAQRKDKELDELDKKDWEKLFPDNKDLFCDIGKKLDIKKGVESYTSPGGPAPEEVKRKIGQEQKWLDEA